MPHVTDLKYFNLCAATASMFFRYYTAIALSCSLLDYGAESNVLIRAMSKKSEETDISMDESTVSEATPDDTFKLALDFATRTISRVLYRWGDTTTGYFPFVGRVPLEIDFHYAEYPFAFLRAWDHPPHPLPEDFAMRGMLYAEDHFPDDWFRNDMIDEDERYFELPPASEERKHRILSLRYRIASSGNWLFWNEETRQFEVPEKYDVKINLDSSLFSSFGLDMRNATDSLYPKLQYQAHGLHRAAPLADSQC
ncbi:hypothetical protein FPRO04_12285 [Fusarium proliferatum]|nr:hypothetical protein FPRO04_12285 [Fusarium proliferatum]